MVRVLAVAAVGAVLGCGSLPAGFSRPVPPDAGVPDFLDSPCAATGHWYLTHTFRGEGAFDDACWPPDGLTVNLDDNGCEVTTPDWLPGAFADTQLSSPAHCRTPTETCAIALTGAVSRYDATSRLSEALQLELSLRQLGDGTFAGSTTLRLSGCGTVTFDTVGAP